ncbi:MoxR family ATPase [Blastococcus sp. Marseille-P5729]|uniref:AAA family ATPase n=1 Tax=Blastococcus sp. Marseille-P5729 TaxID=2086582 RepID=UPI001F1A8D77|nr:MoxR family ATPase [Blastococcus sp. Marseille-P5729]
MSVHSPPTRRSRRRAEEFEPTYDEVRSAALAIATEVEKVISGKRDVVRTAIVCLLCDGHLLIEDVPGVGKTKLARALAAAIDGTVHRVQFTPDLLPSDLTGVSIYDQRQGAFEFTPGPLFGNVVIGDEINRATPKTQSALLEAMEERQVTVDGQTRDLPRPFMVIATQNPVEMEGTFSLPEAQRDRFMAQVEMGYPDEQSEVEMLDQHGQRDPLESLQPVCSSDEVAAMITAVRQTHVAEPIRQYVVALARFTREHAAVRLGASPRAGLQLLRAAKAQAVLSGRDYGTPDDVQRLAPVVWSHRLLMGGHDLRTRHAASDVINEAIQTVAIPR